jgi:hypothetical protein
MSGTIPPLPLYGFMSRTRTTLPLQPVKYYKVLMFVRRYRIITSYLSALLSREEPFRLWRQHCVISCVSCPIVSSSRVLLPTRRTWGRLHLMFLTGRTLRAMYLGHNSCSAHLQLVKLFIKLVMLGPAVAYRCYSAGWYCEQFRLYVYWYYYCCFCYYC